MKEISVIEGNKLIAEFMGNNRNDSDFGFMRKKHYEIAPFGYFDEEQLKYHSSWDWVMTVISKIEKYGCIVEINFSLCCMCRICVIKRSFESGCNFINDDNGLDNPIQAVYKSVIEFIAWYNTQSLTNKN